MEKQDDFERPLIGRRDLEKLLIRKAWADAAFRKQISSDPKSTFEKYLGGRLPEKVRIFVHEEDANTFHFSVPAMPTDQELLPEEDAKKAWEAHALVQLISGIAGGVALSIATNAW